MPRFAANLSMMFNEVDFPARFAAARNAGFDAVEFLFPYDHAKEDVGDWLADQGLANALFNLPPGDWAAGERGMAALPGREAEFEASVGAALAYAAETGVDRLHAMAGITGGLDRAACMKTYEANLKTAAAMLAEKDLTLLIEPINSRDMPGYHLALTDEGLEIIDRVGAPNLRLQFDIYHRQIMSGDVIRALERSMPMIGHIQIASVPERHEPDEGELYYGEIFEVIDALGYDGWIGCEYRPRGDTVEGLEWIAALT
jgi:hydroxypyruvate isomerase